MSRPYRQHSLDDLSTVVDEQRHQPMVLRDVLDELNHRKTKAAKQLKKEVLGILEGRVKVRPEVPAEDSTENQLDMLGDDGGSSD